MLSTTVNVLQFEDRTIGVRSSKSILLKSSGSNPTWARFSLLPGFGLAPSADLVQQTQLKKYQKIRNVSPCLVDGCAAQKPQLPRTISSLEAMGNP
jgi:hypothetical protein